MRDGAGHIALRVQDLPNGARISVADDGIGLPKDDRSRLTEPYVTHKPKGTGLGLAIVKKIMEDHGGVPDTGGSAEWTGCGRKPGAASGRRWTGGKWGVCWRDVGRVCGVG